MQKDAPPLGRDQATISLGAGVCMPYPRPSQPGTRQVMQANRKTDSKPEVRLRSALHGRGLRFKKNHPVSVGHRSVRPDVVFARQKVAVFVDGCFWHGCAVHGTSPRSNADYWRAKLARNRERDLQVDESLRLAGWTVVRVWEHDEPADVAPAIEQLVRTR